MIPEQGASIAQGASITSDPGNRRGFVGGSDIAGVLSLEPYGCARRTWYAKTGATKDRPFVVTGPIEIGVALEEFVARKAAALPMAQARGWRLVRRKAKADGHEGVHIDREIQGDADGVGVAEIKVIGDQSYWQWLREGVPMGYMLQLQWGMHLWGRSWGAVIAWNRDMGGDPQVFRFDRDDELIETIRQHAAAFWALVERGEAPAALSPRDGRCDGCEWGITCREQSWADVSPEVQVIESEQVQRWLRIREVAAEAEDALDAARAEVDVLLSDVLEARCGDVILTHKPQESWRVDIDALKREKPEIAAAYMRKSLSRPLRVKKIKEKKK